MFKFQINYGRTPDFILSLLSMSYITMVILSIVLFNQIIAVNIFDINIDLSGSVIPYVFLYPISFIVLRVYGFKRVNYMIGSMILASLLFVIMSKIVIAVSSNTTEVGSILSNSFRMYLAGFIGMPAGVYSSFLIINLLSKVGMSFNVISLTIATIVGEIVNTIIVFPIGFVGKYSLSTIFSKIIVGALLFKFIMGMILALFTILIINLIINSQINGE